MTGISRFGERGPPWAYSKEEDLSIEDLRMRNFTYLLRYVFSVGWDHYYAISEVSRSQV
jgi:hypothetical protein